MPIYEWKCTFCGNFIEKLQKEPTTPECPECTGVMVRMPSKTGYRRDHTIKENK